ncbi:MAG: hypoxanthine phosphoribosyltransferase [Phycisphaerae bacterium]
MQADLERVLIPRDAIARRVRELAEEIAATYGTDAAGLVMVPVLSGSLIFVADLMRCLPFKMRIAVLTVSSYRGATTSGGEARLVADLNTDIAGRHVLIVDDILDTGRTLRVVRQRLAALKPASLRICVLLRKPGKAPSDVQADFAGFDIEDAFVVGYGLDYNDQYRNWPEIGVLRPELYQ